MGQRSGIVILNPSLLCLSTTGADDQVVDNLFGRCATIHTQSTP